MIFECHEASETVSSLIELIELIWCSKAIEHLGAGEKPAGARKPLIYCER